MVPCAIACVRGNDYNDNCDYDHDNEWEERYGCHRAPFPHVDYAHCKGGNDNDRDVIAFDFQCTLVACAAKPMIFMMGKIQWDDPS